ncbi:hypothetical protein LCGC14_2550670, partial [marine sediment metagenome]
MSHIKMLKGPDVGVFCAIYLFVVLTTLIFFLGTSITPMFSIIRLATNFPIFSEFR